MSDLTVSSVVDDLLAATTQAGMRSVIGASPQLPAWTYTSGLITDGLFTSNGPPNSATTMYFAYISLGNSYASSIFLSSIRFPSQLIMTSETGDVSTLVINNITQDGSGNQILSVQVGALSYNAWSGTYTVAFVPLVANRFATTAQGAKADSAAQPTDITIATALSNSSITPAADGTYSIPTSITIVNGIITAIS